MFKIIRSKSNEKHHHSQETINNEMIIDEQKKNDQDTHKLENYKHNKSENYKDSYYLADQKSTCESRKQLNSVYFFEKYDDSFIMDFYYKQ